jgi:hypothetical protein
MSRTVKNPSGYVSRGRSATDKASNFGKYAREHGWTGSFKEEDGMVHLFARRGEGETIDIWWYPNGSLVLDKLPIYTLAGERIKLRNVSAAAKVAAEEPDTSRLRKAVRKQRGRGDVIAVKGSYDFTGMPDDEIEASLLGRRIVWINSISGQPDTAMVEGRKTLRVTRDSGEDMKSVKAQVHFTDTSGFHAVYLDAIVSVK